MGNVKKGKGLIGASLHIACKFSSDNKFKYWGPQLCFGPLECSYGLKWEIYKSDENLQRDYLGKLLIRLNFIRVPYRLQKR